MISYPKTPRLPAVQEDLVKWRRHHAVVSEKLDGANVGISFADSGDLVLQSRGHILRGGPREYQFERFKALAAALEEQLYDALGTRYVLFCEWLYAKHRSFYDALPGYLVVLDLFDREGEFFLSTPKRRTVLSELALPEAPTLYEGPLGKARALASYIGHSNYKSASWRKHLTSLEGTDDSDAMEGVYVKVEDSERVLARVKIPRPEFEKVRSDDTDWHRRTITPNRCRALP